MEKKFKIYIGNGDIIEDQFENMMDEIAIIVSEEGEKHGWYVGDHIEVSVSVEYKPESK